MDDELETLPGPPPCVVRHRHAFVNGVRLHYVEAEPQPAAEQDNPGLCLLLHGFPEFWYSWRYQLPALAAAGHRALAPDLRGFNTSSKPKGVRHYRLERLAADAAGLIRQAGAERATVIGHDWGGVIAWQLALRHPELVEKLVILNAPHPATYRRELRHPRQLLKSWYVFFFQVPGLPELVLRAGDFAMMRRTLRRDPVRPDAFTPEDVRRYRDALARPGALTATLAYYRAAVLHFRDATRALRVLDVPTLVIWGERDRYLDTRLLDGLERWVPRLRVERLPDASHWVQNDAPERVNRLLLDFLAASAGAPAPRPGP